MFKWGLLVLAVFAALCASTPLFSDDTCGGTSFSTIFFTNNCYNIPAEGACQNSEFCSETASFATKHVAELLTNCTAFTGSFMIDVLGDYTVYSETNCTGTETVTRPTTLCRPFFLCDARSVNLSEFFDGESGSSSSGGSSSSAAAIDAIWA